MWKNIEAAASYLRNKTSHFQPEIALILGTGLGSLTDSIEKEFELPYAEIPGFPNSTVRSHGGSLIFGKIGQKSIVAMNGRVHFYEGYSLQEVVFPVRVMLMLGAKSLWVTNAAGGLAPQMEKGEIMCITDHINMLGTSPLIGPDDERYGPRFPDMSCAYDRNLIMLAREVALSKGIRLHEGVYAFVSGPNLETPAEYNAIRILGADTVGMSTVPEVIAAVHMGIPCFGLSAITDLGVPGKIQATHLEDVIEEAGKAGRSMAFLIVSMIEGLSL
jgi:purine-nucleoside phosphorylase